MLSRAPAASSPGEAAASGAPAAFGEAVES